MFDGKQLLRLWCQCTMGLIEQLYEEAYDDLTLKTYDDLKINIRCLIKWAPGLYAMIIEITQIKTYLFKLKYKASEKGINSFHTSLSSKDVLSLLM